MGFFHFHGQIIKRSAGKSATAAAAYRAGTEIADRTLGEVFDYSRKGGVHGSSILAPSHAPEWVYDRAELWNRVEESETRLNSQLAREFDIGIPIELDNHDRIELVRQFVQEMFVDKGMIADVAFHDFASHNPHCHVMLTMRNITSEGFAAKKNRSWNDQKLVDHWRERWATYANRYLEKAGFDVRIDHRSYEARGIDLAPTKHLGAAAAALDKRGLSTRIGDHNRQVFRDNAQYMDCLVHIDIEHQDEMAALENERATVLAEIERIRKETLTQLSTSGTIEVSDYRDDIADRAEGAAARISTGMAASFADYFKAKLFADTWHADLDPSLLKQIKWIDVDTRSLTLRSGEQIVDKGSSVSLSKGSDDAITAAVSMARAKGWETVKINGSDEFQLRAALALKDANIEPSFTSEIAKTRFSDILGEQGAAAQKPEPKPDSEPMPEPEVKPEPERELEIDLGTIVHAAVGRHSLAPTNAFRDDTRKLRTWARAVWDDLVADGEAEGLADIFVEVMEEQALMGGYTVHEIKTVGLDDTWSKMMAHQNPERSPSSRPSPMTRRKWYPDSGNKPPET